MLYRASQGLILSLGSPLGWLAIQLISGVDIYRDIANNYAVYLYMTWGTAIVFTGFGAYLGRKEQVLSKITLVDELTKLHNTRYFNERLSEAFSQHQRSGERLSLVMLDIDHFKNVNDSFGHTVGDNVLVAVANALVTSCRAGESASRVGGEELCVILEHCLPEEAVLAAERFRRAIGDAKVKLNNGGEISVTVSAGVATTNSETADVKDVYQAADEAMYQAKQTGRDKTCASSY